MEDKRTMEELLADSRRATKRLEELISGHDGEDYKRCMHDVSRCGKRLSSDDADRLVTEIRKHGRDAHIVKLRRHDYRVFMGSGSG